MTRRRSRSRVILHDISHCILHRIVLATMGAAALLACASTGFERQIQSRQWPAAAATLAADSSLLSHENTLFQAAMLYSFPDRSTYDVARATELFQRFLRAYPSSAMHQAARDQLSLLYELERTGNASATRLQSLQADMARLASDTLRLHTTIDSLAAGLRSEQDQSALLRRSLQEKQAQLSALHDELTHLKAIDLQPRPRSAKPSKPS